MNTRASRQYRVLVIFTLFLFMLILYGCTNDSATINSVTIRPLVAATYGATIGPTLSEGIAVSLQSQPLDRDAQ